MRRIPDPQLEPGRLDLETRHQLVQYQPQPYARSGNNRNKVVILLGKKNIG